MTAKAFVSETLKHSTEVYTCMRAALQTLTQQKLVRLCFPDCGNKMSSHTSQSFHRLPLGGQPTLKLQLVKATNVCTCTPLCLLTGMALWNTKSLTKVQSFAFFFSPHPFFHLLEAFFSVAQID